MILSITEIQITCAVLMVLVSQLLLYATPRLIHPDEVLTHSRKMLGTGTLLIAVHFFLQYFLHKTALIDPATRITLNLSFALPFTYCFNVSLLYLQRKGQIEKKEYAFFRYTWILAAVTLVVCQSSRSSYPVMGSVGNLVLALCAAATQLYANYLQIKEYRQMRQFLKNGGEDPFYRQVIRWTRGSMFFMATTGVLLPIMVFISNTSLRGMYGILSLAAGHFYIFSFLGLLIQRERLTSVVPDAQSSLTSDLSSADLAENKKRYETNKLQLITRELPRLESQRIYLKPGLTQGHLAETLGVSSHVLSHYFQSSPYGKFTVWMQQKRISYAKQLLQEHPDWSNQTISQACGYTNRSYFQAQFMDITGMSPVQWSEENLQKSDAEPTEENN